MSEVPRKQKLQKFCYVFREFPVEFLEDIRFKDLRIYGTPRCFGDSPWNSGNSWNLRNPRTIPFGKFQKTFFSSERIFYICIINLKQLKKQDGKDKE